MEYNIWYGTNGVRSIVPGIPSNNEQHRAIYAVPPMSYQAMISVDTTSPYYLDPRQDLSSRRYSSPQMGYYDLITGEYRYRSEHHNQYTLSSNYIDETEPPMCDNTCQWCQIRLPFNCLTISMITSLMLLMMFGLFQAILATNTKTQINTSLFSDMIFIMSILTIIFFLLILIRYCCLDRFNCFRTQFETESFCNRFYRCVMNLFDWDLSDRFGNAHDVMIGQQPTLLSATQQSNDQHKTLHSNQSIHHHHHHHHHLSDSHPNYQQRFLNQHNHHHNLDPNLYRKSFGSRTSEIKQQRHSSQTNFPNVTEQFV